MSDSENQLIRIGDEDVFLVLTEQTGSDFTFYLRNNDEAKLVNCILQKGKGGKSNSVQTGVAKAAQQTNDTSASPQTSPKAKVKSSKQKFSYSCRINILRVLLDKKDLEADPSNPKQPILLQKLIAVGDNATDQSPYALLRKELSSKTRQSLIPNKVEDKDLIKSLVKELNELLTTNKLKGLFTTPLTVEERKLLKQVTDKAAMNRLSNYLRFCDSFSGAIKPLKARIKVGRVLAGLAYEGSIWSLSFREQDREGGYEPDKDAVSNLSDEKAVGNMNSIEELCQSLYEEIFYAITQSEPPDGNPQQESKIDDYRKKIDRHRKGKTLPEISGLVVISGSTNSAKSLITRGLIHLYLENVINDEKQKRRPHLITFEEPIEKFYATDSYVAYGAHSQLDVAMKALEKKIDYTPRQQKADLRTLQEALRDALRQTPKVFFVGETRKSKDWRELINFAGTGHLIITTAHAGSLVEAMHKIFLATNAKTPADRSEVANRLLAVVHLKRTEIGEYQYGVLIPALWRRVPRGLNALISEGLASVLPHSHSNDRNPCSCLGRKYFVEKLLELAKDRQSAAVEDALITKAIDWDLQGV